MLAIYKREMRAYFTSMIGCVFLAFFVAVGSLYFIISNLLSGYTYFSYSIASITLFLIFGIPMLTMRCFAEEKKNKTEQLFMTAPISLTEVVLGKYFAMVTIFVIPNLLYCTFPLIIKSLGTSHLLVDYSTILAFTLMGCVFIAIGMYISTMTESQVIAIIISFLVFYVVYMWESLWSLVPFPEVSELFSKFSLMAVLKNFAYYDIFDVTGLIAYISVIGVFVFLTVQALQKRRWN